MKRKHWVTGSLVFLFLCFLPVTSYATLNLKFNFSKAENLKVSYDTATDVYTIVFSAPSSTLSTDSLSRILFSKEIMLSFEYTSTSSLSSFGVTFQPSAGGGGMVSLSKPGKSVQWKTFSSSLSTYLTKYSWGHNRADFLRFRFGGIRGDTLRMRHVRLCKQKNDPWQPEFAEPAFDDIVRLGLPVLNITTEEHQEPTCDFVSAPKGCFGTSIVNAVKIKGRMQLYPGGALRPVYDSGPFDGDKGGITIRLRGNSSAYEAKQPYKIKLRKKADLLFRGDDATYADKDWVLVRDDSLQTIVGLQMNDLVGLQWTPAAAYVNVVFNGRYRGLYLLVESVKRNTLCRINVDKSGYIFERDPYWWNAEKYVLAADSPHYNFTFKFPDEDNFTEADSLRMQRVVKDFEYSVPQGTYPKYIDVGSFAAWLLGHDILGTYDSGGSNQYFTKRDSSSASIIEMGCMWDFDSSLSRLLNSKWSRIHTGYFASLLSSRNKMFARLYKEQWRELEADIFDGIKSLLDSVGTGRYSRALATSIELDNKRWGNNNPDLSLSVEHARSWFNTRRQWLEKNVPAISDSEPEQNPTLRAGETIKIQAEEYDNGGREVGYHDHHTTQGSYRSDNDGVSLRTGNWYAAGWAVGDMGNDWYQGTSDTLTFSEAVDKYGAWYQYTFTADDDLQVAVNLRTALNWGDYNSTSTSSATAPIAGAPELSRWVATFSGAARVSIDGHVLNTLQTVHPVNNGMPLAEYKAVLNDKSLWTPNLTRDIIWFYPHKDSLTLNVPFYQKDLYAEPDNFVAHVSKGRHVIRVTSLAGKWNFDELSLRAEAEPEGVLSVSAEDGLKIEGRTVYVGSADDLTLIEAYDMYGHKVCSATGRRLTLPAAGLYIIKVGQTAVKVSVP